MSQNLSPKQLDQIEAAEYVLRLMPRDQERAFEARMASNRVLENHVSDWVRHFSPLNEEIVAKSPPSAIRGRLMTDLFGDDPQPTPYWQTANPWRSLTFLTGGLAAAFGLALLAEVFLGGADSGINGPVYVTEITARSDDLRLLALFEAETGVLRLSRTSGVITDDRSFELWAIEGDLPPHSLGLLSSETQTSVTVPQDLRLDLSKLIFAISEEPAGGSAEGKPSGTILAAGRLTGL